MEEDVEEETIVSEETKEEIKAYQEALDRIRLRYAAYYIIM